MLSWIPILGPIIEGIVSIFNKKMDTTVQLSQIKAGVDVEDIKAANDLTKAFADDICVRICRDIIMFPGSVYCGTIVWDRFVDIRHPEWVWGVKPLEGVMEYLPFALLTFFFGSAFLYWKRK